MRLKSHVIELGNRSELAVSWRTDAGRDRLLIEQRHRHVFRYFQCKFIDFGINELRVVEFRVDQFGIIEFGVYQFGIDQYGIDQYGIIERSSRCDHINRLADGDCGHGL
jgi:hypothetical protein